MVITESALRLASVLLSLCFLQLSPSDTPFLDLTQDFHTDVNVNGWVALRLYSCMLDCLIIDISVLSLLSSRSIKIFDSTIKQEMENLYGLCGSRNSRRSVRRATDVKNGNAGPS